jgi:hypothetical protein
LTNLIIPRYSPKPIEDYSPVVRGIGVGPAYSALLAKDLEAWNLAWLSHEYEKSPEHDDPMFTTLVSRTLRMVRDTGSAGPPGVFVPAHRTVRGLLRLPPGEFWDHMAAEGLLRKTPLYAAYGEAWADLAFERAVWEPFERNGVDLTEARRALEKAKDAHN